MIRLLAVIERDFKKFKRNPMVLAMSIFMPIIYLVILGNSFQGKLQALPLIVVNHDSGPYARRFMENLQAVEAGPQNFTILVTTGTFASLDSLITVRLQQFLTTSLDTPLSFLSLGLEMRQRQ